MVRLKYAYIVECKDVVKDANGQITEIHCEYIPESKSGDDTSGLKVKGTIHWVSAKYGVNMEVRMYDRLFMEEDPSGDDEKDFKEFLNPDSLKVISNAVGEPLLANVEVEQKYQFERKGYFCLDPDSREGKPVFNLTVPLRDSWAKISQKMNDQN